MFQNIALVELAKFTPADGSGQMSGNVSYREGVELKGTVAKPVTRTSVILVRRTSRKSTLDNAVVAHIMTNGLGDYGFNYIPDGDYTLIVDVPGLPMFNSYEVTIIADKIVSGLDFVVGPRGINTADRVGVKSLSLDRIMVFPNPGSGQVYIHLPAAGDYRVEVINTLGQLVQSGEFPSAAGPVLMDVSALEDGLYIFNIQGDKWTEMVKYLKE